MAAATTLNIMTLGPGLQHKTMQGIPQTSTCVIVTSGPQQNSPIQHHIIHHPKTVVIKEERALTPMDMRGTVVVSNSPTQISAADALRCKRKINFAQSATTGVYATGLPGLQPASVARRNARERNRVKQVNNGFATLRSHIPLSIATAVASPTNSSGRSSASKKLSKVETLRMAVEYIRSLQDLLEEHDMSRGKEVVTPVQEMVCSVSSPETISYYSGSPESTATTTTTVSSFQPSSTPHHHLQMEFQGNSLPPESLSPSCSESSSSDSPAHSNASSELFRYLQWRRREKIDAYWEYDPMSPEVEELLDEITRWQDSK